MNHLEKVAAAQYLTKQAWDRDAWYSWIPIVGDVGNAVSNFSDGNIGDGFLDLGMGALNVIPGLGAVAGAGIKGGVRAGRYAVKGINAAKKVAPKLTKNLPSAGATQKAVQQGAESLGKGINKTVGAAGRGLNKIPLVGKPLANVGKGLYRSGGKGLAGIAGINAGLGIANNYFGGQQAPVQAGGFQMPNLNFGGGQGPSSAASRLSRGRMAGYDVY
jgi:hypothetical protein